MTCAGSGLLPNKSMLQPTIRPRRCKAKSCREQFTPARQMQAVCGWKCAQEVAKVRREKEAAEAAKQERAMTRAEKERLKSTRKLAAEVKEAMHRWVRLRDEGKPCICCGKPMEPQRFGGSVDAGHYLSVGSAKHLQFDERNIHAQRKSCNRPGGTTRASFRAGMIARIGLEAVEALEADQTPRKYTADQLREMRDRYRRLARELERERLAA